MNSEKRIKTQELDRGKKAGLHRIKDQFNEISKTVKVDMTKVNDILKRN